ncbi:D123-domain-containing protein [Piedraia hortae CBS 480.64]|uniref:D123-domain-containing protein n=1 Tax=Piedraia hortae CBS 480.64 TaxID=1314780 RepID=A0A6A7BZ28_9PEZI|nr:D123-domain-containing protein [Piedraia hortae CBS 480.64]
MQEDHKLTFEPTAQPEFSPIIKSHILNCSYNAWYPIYRHLAPKSEIIPLTKPFIEYLKCDGIVVPPDKPSSQDDDSDNSFTSTSSFASWSEIHTQITRSITKLGGHIIPKLNWSSPKDATWMNANTLECTLPSQIYLLLKASDFVMHDFEYPFDGCVASSEGVGGSGKGGKGGADEKKGEGSFDDKERVEDSDDAGVEYVLVLRKYMDINPASEFRCFAFQRKVVGISQRDVNYYPFLHPMRETITTNILTFFEKHLRTFSDENFVFDVYLPESGKVWLVDINPFAPRTDALLFEWGEVLGMDRDAPPEVRFVEKNDPRGFNFGEMRFSASKLPIEVVDAGRTGEGIVEFARGWRDIIGGKGGEETDEEG